MGVSGMSMGSVLLILIVVLFLFGGQRVANFGEELGKAIKGFKKALEDDKDSKS